MSDLILVVDVIWKMFVMIGIPVIGMATAGFLYYAVSHKEN